MIDIPTFELNGDGQITIDGYNIVVTDVSLDEESLPDKQNIIVEYAFVDDNKPSNIDDFEHALQRFMIGLVSPNVEE